MTSPTATPQQVARELVAEHNRVWNDTIAYPLHLIDRITAALEATAKSAREDERERTIEDIQQAELPDDLKHLHEGFDYARALFQGQLKRRL